MGSIDRIDAGDCATPLPVTRHGAHDIIAHLLCAAPSGQLPQAHGFGLMIPSATQGAAHGDRRFRRTAPAMESNSIGINSRGARNAKR